MKIFVSMAASLLIVLVFSVFVLAQQGPGAGPGPGFQQGTGKQVTPEQFTGMKTHVLNMIEARRAKLDEAKACATAATTPDELRKCRPEHPMGGRGPGMRGQRGPGMQQPQQQPAAQQ